jgi:hypothetical protein
MFFKIIINKELIHEYHQHYMQQNPKCKTLPFAKSESIKLFNKDGSPQLTKGGSQKTKKKSISKKNYEMKDCMYGVLSLNELLVIQNRMVMNGKKHAWGELGIWIAEKYNMSNLKISNCMVEFKIFSETLAKKDNDNISAGIKFLGDGLFVQSGMCEDDNYFIVNPLLINCDYDKSNPRTEIRISVFEDKLKDVYEKIKIHSENFKKSD